MQCTQVDLLFKCNLMMIYLHFAAFVIFSSDYGGRGLYVAVFLTL